MLVGLTKRLLLTGWLVTRLLVVPARTTELKATTAAAFDDYTRATEVRMSDELRGGHFLIIDNLPETRRQEAYAKLQEGQIHIEQLNTKEDGRPVHVPDGIDSRLGWRGVHTWRDNLRNHCRPSGLRQSPKNLQTLCAAFEIVGAQRR
jgi:hypothetical protein